MGYTAMTQVHLQYISIDQGERNMSRERLSNEPLLEQLQYAHLQTLIL